MKFHSFTNLHIQEGDVVVVVELRVEAADGAILARDREQPVERIREEHVVKAEVLRCVKRNNSARCGGGVARVWGGEGRRAGGEV